MRHDLTLTAAVAILSNLHLILRLIALMAYQSVSSYYLTQHSVHGILFALLAATR